MTIGDFTDFRQRRAAWIAQISNAMVVRSVERVLDPDKISPVLSSPELALMSAATGLGHILGIDDDDLAIDGYLTNEEVAGLISRVWRGGFVPGEWSASLLETYETLFVGGRDTGLVRPSLLDALAGSQLHARLSTYVPPEDLSSAPSSFVDELVDTAIDVHAEANVPALEDPDLNPSHLPLVAWLLSRLPDNAQEVFTPIEVREAQLSKKERASPREDVDAWCRLKFIPLSMPGSWPARAGDSVPVWVREEVIEVGARFAHASTGNVPGWYFTSESDEEKRGFQAWTYAPGFCFRLAGSSVELGFVLRFDADDHSPVWYRYPFDDFALMANLRAILAIGLVRVDHYTIDSDARLRHVQTFGTPLPQRLISECREALDSLRPERSEVLHLHLEEVDDVLDAMAIVDRNGLEGLEVFAQAQAEGEETEITSSYRRMLEIVDAATQDAVRGASLDQRLLAESRDEVRDALSHTDRNAAPLDLSRLGARRAYVQLRLHQETFYLHCFVAYVDEAGPVTHQFEFSDTINLRALPADIEDCVDALTQGMDEFRTLLSAGVDKLVLRTSPSLYGIPWHEALLRIGFVEVTFTHRLNALRPSPLERPGTTRALVRGFAGNDGAYLPAVSIELETITALYEEAALGPDEPPDVVHLSGHAVTGDSPYSVAIHDEVDHSLSSARVVLDWNLGGTAVVVLSACSTGTVYLALDQVHEAIPLDVAFISAGAAAVVSTCAPVNDIVAAVFSCAFHHAYASGETVWNAFMSARELARGDDAGQGLGLWLDQRWPTWREELRAALASGPHDWQLFRVVGRHW